MTGIFRLTRNHDLQWMAYLQIYCYFYICIHFQQNSFLSMYYPTAVTGHRLKLVHCQWILVSLSALLHRAAKHGDMRCLSHETHHEVSSKGWEVSYFIQAQILVSCPQTFSPENMRFRTLTKGYDQPTKLVIPIIIHLSCPIISVGRSSVSLRWLVQINANTLAKFELEHYATDLSPNSVCDWQDMQKCEVFHSERA